MSGKTNRERVLKKNLEKEERKTEEHMWLWLPNLKNHPDTTTIKATQGWKIRAFQISRSRLKHARGRARKLAFHIRKKRPVMIFILLANSPDGCKHIPEDHTLTNWKPLQFYIFTLNESLFHENKPQNGRKNSNGDVRWTWHWKYAFNLKALQWISSQREGLQRAELQSQKNKQKQRERNIWKEV